jgi:phosphohistidine phosphatase
MKSVLLVRHAKSSWDTPGVPDFDRPLNDRGKHDAPLMANRLLAKDISIDSFISSTAKRARRTAALFAAEYGVNKEQIILVPELYQASPAIFFSAISNAPTHANHITIFAHNPSITEFANLISGTRIDDMPTCSIFAVKTNINQWSEFEKSEKEFWFFDYPKAEL